MIKLALSADLIRRAIRKSESLSKHYDTQVNIFKKFRTDTGSSTIDRTLNDFQNKADKKFNQSQKFKAYKGLSPKLQELKNMREGIKLD